MEWLLRNGTYVPLTATQALMIDVRATIEDFVAALEGLDEAIETSRSLVSNSRRWRNRRQSGLRLVSAQD